MAVHVELRLIAKILETKNIRPFIQRQLDGDRIFLLPEARAMYQFIWDYYHHPNHYGKVPTVEHLRNSFAGFIDLPEQEESLEELLEFVRQDTLAHNILNLLDETYETLQVSPNDAVQLLRSRVLSLIPTTGSTQDVCIQDALGDVIKRYFERKTGVSRGLPFPWPEVTEWSHGLGPGDLCILFGRYKTGKSALAIWWAVYLYLQANQRVLFYSPELGRQKLTDRVTCALMRLDWDALERGALTREQEKELAHTERLLLEQHADTSTRAALMLCTDLSRDRISTISLLREKVQEFKPDVIFADSFYKFSAGKKTSGTDLDWKAVGQHCVDLKMLGTELGIPIVGMTQANTARDAAFANTVLMSECDLALRCISRDTDIGRVFGLCSQVARNVRPAAFKVLFSLYTQARFLGWSDPEKIDEELQEDFSSAPAQPVTARAQLAKQTVVDQKLRDHIRAQFTGRVG